MVCGQGFWEEKLQILRFQLSPQYGDMVLCPKSTGGLVGHDLLDTWQFTCAGFFYQTSPEFVPVDSSFCKLHRGLHFFPLIPVSRIQDATLKKFTWHKTQLVYALPTAAVVNSTSTFAIFLISWELQLRNPSQENGLLFQGSEALNK